MADRRDYFFRQKVTEAELDEGFDLLEQADRALASDHGLWGILQNCDVTEKSGTPDLSVDVSGPGVAYDQQGQRLNFSGSAQNVDCSLDEGGASTAVVTPSNTRWLSVFLAFDRELADPRTDGASSTVYFERNEAVQFNVVAGAEHASSPVRPSLRGDEILLADILLTHGHTQIVNADIDKSRTQVLITTTAGIAERTIADAFQAIEDEYVAIGTDFANHKIAAGAHDAANITNTPAGNIAATTVQAAIDELDAEKAQIGGPLVAMAWAQVETDGVGGFTVNDSENITGVAFLSGALNFDFVTLPNNNNYAVVPGTNVPGEIPTAHMFTGSAGAGFRINITDNAGAAVDLTTNARLVYVIVFGNLT